MAVAVPIARSRRIDTRLRDRYERLAQARGPAELRRREFSGRHEVSMPSPSSTMGASSSTEAGVKPFSSAAEYRNGLKPEPGRRPPA